MGNSIIQPKEFIRWLGIVYDTKLEIKAVERVNGTTKQKKMKSCEEKLMDVSVD